MLHAHLIILIYKFKVLFHRLVLNLIRCFFGYYDTDNKSGWNDNIFPAVY